MNSVSVSPYPLKVPIDPRIRQRRIAVRRDEGRRRLRIFLGVIVLAVLSTAGWIASRSPLLDIDAVEVEGSTRTSAALLREAAGVDRGRAMVDVDEAAAVRQVEALPWVADATVVRRWPGTISITVTERSALVATLDATGNWWLVDRSGRVLEQASSRPAELVALEGVEALPAAGGVAANVGAALTVAAALSPELQAVVDAIVVVQGGGVDLRLKGQGSVQLGSLENLDQKLGATESILASVNTGGLVTLDGRFPASPVLTRQE